jgi:cellulose synthase (UDP-forming)
VCVELPRYRREERFATSEPVSILADGRVFTAPLIDISANGARIMGPSPGFQDGIVQVTLEGVGQVAGRIVAGSSSSFAVQFINNDVSRDALIRKVFSGRYYRRPPQVAGRQVLGALVARTLR